MPKLRYLLLLVAPSVLVAQTPVPSKVTPNCSSCAEWNAEQAPVRIFGNAYYVGPHGLGAILITSPTGHILIDGGLMESAPAIVANIRSLRFLIEDVKIILNSHVHYDHAGGLAGLVRMSGAQVAASPKSALVLERGTVGPDDPQFGLAQPIAPIAKVRVIVDGETIRVGPIAVTAHFTPGHTPGGTTWTWESCESTRCLGLVYADSQTPVSADGFRFSNSAPYPTALADFKRSAAVLDSLRCDILVTTHPGASSFWDRIDARKAGNDDALVNPQACREFATRARAQLAKRIAEEQ
jgi:metallo-beta-lactamase class B